MPGMSFDLMTVPALSVDGEGLSGAHEAEACRGTAASLVSLARSAPATDQTQIEATASARAYAPSQWSREGRRSCGGVLRLVVRERPTSRLTFFSFSPTQGDPFPPPYPSR